MGEKVMDEKRNSSVLLSIFFYRFTKAVENYNPLDSGVKIERDSFSLVSCILIHTFLQMLVCCMFVTIYLSSSSILSTPVKNYNKMSFRHIFIAELTTECKQ